MTHHSPAAEYFFLRKNGFRSPFCALEIPRCWKKCARPPVKARTLYDKQPAFSCPIQERFGCDPDAI